MQSGFYMEMVRVQKWLFLCRLIRKLLDLPVQLKKMQGSLLGARGLDEVREDCLFMNDCKIHIIVVLFNKSLMMY